MDRAQEIKTLLSLIERVGFTPTERMILSWGISQGQTHKEIAAKLGIQTKSSEQALRRARVRAARHGILIPPKRRGHRGHYARAA